MPRVYPNACCFFFQDRFKRGRNDVDLDRVLSERDRAGAFIVPDQSLFPVI